MKYIANKQEGAERHVAETVGASPVKNRRTTETDRYRLDYESPTQYKRHSHAPRIEKRESAMNLNNFLESHKTRVLQEQESHVKSHYTDKDRVRTSVNLEGPSGYRSDQMNRSPTRNSSPVQMRSPMRQSIDPAKYLEPEIMRPSKDDTKGSKYSDLCEITRLKDQLISASKDFKLLNTFLESEKKESEEKGHLILELKRSLDNSVEPIERYQGEVKRMTDVVAQRDEEIRRMLQRINDGNMETDRLQEECLMLKKDFDQLGFKYESEKKMSLELQEKFEMEHISLVEYKKKYEYEKNKYEIEHSTLIEYQRKLKVEQEKFEHEHFTLLEMSDKLKVEKER